MDVNEQMLEVENDTSEYETVSYTFSLIRQGNYRFYSLTMPSNVLGETCFVTSRYENNVEGFQRRLEEKRADEIAKYIDSGLGTIPTAVILSAQPEADLQVKKGGRALTFKCHPKSFLVIDGQHRVWGFHKANTDLRVPVIIYVGLTRTEETRLFIDINTKQKPVPTELLLDIKHLAEMENKDEEVLRDLFNIFHSDPNSILKGKLSPSERVKGKLSRTNFNNAFNSIINIILEQKVPDLFMIFNAYLSAFYLIFKSIECQNNLLSPTIFKSVISFFPEVAMKVKDRYQSEYTTDNFLNVMRPIQENLNKQHIVKANKSYKVLYEVFKKHMNTSFSL